MGDNLVQLYMILVLSTIAHELGHYVTAKIIGLKEAEISIGSEFAMIHLGKVHFSPIVFSGHVKFSPKDLLRKNTNQIIAFFISGITVNIVIIAISGIFYNNSLLMSNVFWINVSILPFNLLPFIPPQNDMTKLIKYLKYKKRLSRSNIV